MNNRFGELAKGLAQSVTRRHALRRFGIGIAGVLLASLGLGPVCAADLYVDANAAAGGNGAASGPFLRITDAVGSRGNSARPLPLLPASESLFTSRRAITSARSTPTRW